MVMEFVLSFAESALENVPSDVLTGVMLEFLNSQTVGSIATPRSAADLGLHCETLLPVGWRSHPSSHRQESFSNTT